MSVFDILQFLGGIILSLGYMPQIIKLIRTKSSKDFNIKSFSLVCFAIFLMEIYAIHLTFENAGFMYLITNTMSLIVQIIMLFLIHKYRENR